jgi:MFS transporter, DHA2 family, methylenomycin A resistance protein
MVSESRTATAPPRAWAALALVAGGLFLAVMSTTVVSVALPSIGATLGASSTQLEWVVDAYVIVYSSLLVAGGVAGDRLGRKGLFLTGAACFGLGSLLAGLAPSVGILLAGRALQGLGPALLIPGSLTIIRAVFEDERKRAVAIGLWSTASGAALAAGPALGGALTTGPGWRSVFLFNVPLTAILVLLSARYIPRLRRVEPAGRFDWPGAVLTAAAVALLAFATIEGQAGRWSSAPVVAAMAAGAAALAGFVAWERRRAHPLVEVSLFRRPAFTAANAAAFVVFFAFVGAIVYFSAYFQQAQGQSAITAGRDVSAIGVAFAIAASASGRLVAWIGPRWPMTGGLVIAGAAMLGLLRLQLHTGLGAIWWNFALLGAGIGLSLTPMTSVAMSAAGASRAGMVSAVHNSLRQVGQVFGVAILGALVYAHLGGGAAGPPLPPAKGRLFVAGLHNALWVSGMSLLAAAALAAILLASHRHRPAAGGRPDRRGRAARPGRCALQQSPRAGSASGAAGATAAGKQRRSPDGDREPLPVPCRTRRVVLTC